MAAIDWIKPSIGNGLPDNSIAQRDQGRGTRNRLGIPNGLPLVTSAPSRDRASYSRLDLADCTDDDFRSSCRSRCRGVSH